MIVKRKMQFTYPNYSASGIQHEGMPDYAAHSGQIVEVLEELSDAFRDGEDNACRGYRVKAKDGWEGVVWPGELRETAHDRPSVENKG